MFLELVQLSLIDCGHIQGDQPIVINKSGIDSSHSQNLFALSDIPMSGLHHPSESSQVRPHENLLRIPRIIHALNALAIGLAAVVALGSPAGAGPAGRV